MALFCQHFKTDWSKTLQIQDIDTAKLHFDEDNPRFYRLRGSLETNEFISEMVEAEGVFDPMESIGIKDRPSLTVVEGKMFPKLIVKE